MEGQGGPRGSWILVGRAQEGRWRAVINRLQVSAGLARLWPGLLLFFFSPPFGNCAFGGPVLSGRQAHSSPSPLLSQALALVSSRLPHSRATSRLHRGNKLSSSVLCRGAVAQGQPDLPPSPRTLLSIRGSRPSLHGTWRRW